MVTVLGTALAVTLGLLVRDYDDMRINLAAHAKSLGRVMANTLVTPLLHDDLWRAYEILESSREAQTTDAGMEAQIMLVLDQERMVFVSNRPRDFRVGQHLEESRHISAELIDALNDAVSLEQRIIDPKDTDFYFVVTPLVTDGVMLGHIALGYAKSAFLPRYLNMAGRAGIVTLLVLLVLLPASWIWAGKTAAPLLQLAKAMESLPTRPEDAELVKLPKSNDEIGRLGHAFLRMVEEVKRKQELEGQMLTSERLAAVGRLSAGIAHEINNPLGGMLTAIKTFERHGTGDSIAAQTFSLLERGLTQIRHTVAALLVETKVQDRPFEAADIDDLRILIEPAVREKSVFVNFDANLPAPLPLPATLLRQILLNLLLNAIDAAAINGNVRLELKRAEGMLILVVTNDGQHIPDEKLAYIFEPFSTDKAKGHGLGLWIVYQIVQQLNGGLAVESQPGLTTIRIDIPYEPS